MSIKEELDSGDDLMAISVQALKGTKSNTIRLRGYISD